MKKCTKCKTLQPRENYNKDSSRGEGLSFRCRTCDAAYRTANRARLSEMNRVWRTESREQRRAYSRAYSRRRKEVDVAYDITCRLRNRVKMACARGRKISKFWTLTGCTIGELLEHLESRFQPGMTWGNRGDWHIDHIKPCALFDLGDPDQQRKCFHYTNLQPLWARDNLAKGSKYFSQEQAA